MLCIVDSNVGHPLAFQPNKPLAAIEPMSWQYLDGQHLVGRKIGEVFPVVVWWGFQVL